MRQAAQLAAVVRRLGYGVAELLEQLVDLVKQVPTARGQAWHVLEHDQVDRVVGLSLAHQPDAPQRHFVQRQVFGRLAERLAQQAAGAFAWGTDEHDVWRFITGCTANIDGGGLAPTCWRLFTVKGRVLGAREQVHNGTMGARASAVEVADRRSVVVDSADAAQRRGHIADLRLRGIESLLPAAEAAAKV